MNNYYDLNTWSKLYREEALQAASRRDLVEQANGNRRPRSRLGRIEFALSGALHGLKG
jgi:hypothetical protein